MLLKKLEFMNSILLVAHGSRLKQSNDEVFKLADQLKRANSVTYDIVRTAFLEISSPSIQEGINLCVQAGATSIMVLPYFLNSGRHVTNDIPQIIKNARENYPGVTIEITPHLGASDLMSQLLIKLINSLPET